MCIIWFLLIFYYFLKGIESLNLNDSLIFANPIYKANVICFDMNNEQLACDQVQFSLEYFSNDFGQRMMQFQIDQNTVLEKI